MNYKKYVTRAQKDGIIQFLKQNGNKRVLYVWLGQDYLLSPEEEVRLLVLLQLIYDHHYPLKSIILEYPVKMGASYKRVDIVIIKDTKEQKGHPFIIIECKKIDTSKSDFQEAIHQAISYNNTLLADYIWISSWQHNVVLKNEYQARNIVQHPVQQLPDYTLREKAGSWFKKFLKEVLQSLSDVLVYFIFPILRSKLLLKILGYCLLLLIISYFSCYFTLNYLADSLSLVVKKKELNWWILFMIHVVLSHTLFLLFIFKNLFKVSLFRSKPVFVICFLCMVLCTLFIRYFFLEESCKWCQYKKAIQSIWPFEHLNEAIQMYEPVLISAPFLVMILLLLSQLFKQTVRPFKD